MPGQSGAAGEKLFEQSIHEHRRTNFEYEAIAQKWYDQQSATSIRFNHWWNVFIAEEETADTAFAIYYGKFQGIAPKANRIISMIEDRLEQNVEYEHLLNELHKLYLFQRASVSNPPTNLPEISDWKSSLFL